MLRNLIVLPNGTEISTGKYAIKTAQHKALSNSGTELTPGSVCAAMLEVSFFSPGNSLGIAEGTEVTYYKVHDDGTRTKVGLYTMEKPQVPSKNSYKFTAYDRVSWLDKDLTAWLQDLTEWPYYLSDFAQMVCDECGLTLKNTILPNGDFQVQKFITQCTGRQIMQWIGQICGRFCRATPEGELEFAWYSESGKVIKPTGDLFYFQNSLNYEDYAVTPVEKIHIQLSDDDVGVVYPDEAGEKNTYVINDNYLLAGGTPAQQLSVAQTLYDILSQNTYTPCKVAIPANLDIAPGDIVTVEDRNGKQISVYVMTKTQKGQRDTIECTGSARRNSSTAVNNEFLKNLQGKTFRIQKTVDGLKTRAADLEGRFSAFEQTAGQVKVEVGASGGVLSTNITAATEEEPAKWEAYYKDADGKVLSGFYFDFQKGQFMFDGSGKFTGQINVNDMFLVDELGNLTSYGKAMLYGGKFYALDGSGWFEMGADGYVLYSKSGEQVLKMGFPEGQKDYPYVWLGGAISDGGDSGMAKRFADGLWFGNSAPVAESGNFVAKEGYNGIFISFEESKTYVVKDTTMTSLYTGEAIARFG